MKIVKYDKLKAGQVKADQILSGGGGGGSTTTIEGGGSVSLDRVIWGKQDTGDDIDGHMTVNGDVHIKAIDYQWDDDDDDEGTGDVVVYDEGGGNLNVELKTTTRDLEATNDAYVHKHLYINYSHDSHGSNKRCVADLIKVNETNIKTNADNIAVNASNIRTNANEISGLKTRMTTAETNISNNANNIAANATSISNLATRVSNNETNIGKNTTNIASNATAISELAARLSTAEANISSDSSGLSDLAARLSTAESNISNNATAISSNATSISNLASRVSTAESNISKNTTNIASNATSISMLASRVGTNETNISNNSTSISNLSTRVSNNETNISSNTTEIENIKNQMANGSSVDALMRQIETLKYGDLYNPVILYSGVLSKLSTSDIYTNNGCLKDCLQLSITDITQGIMTIEITPRYGLGQDIYCYVRSVDAIQEMSDDTRERKYYYKERSNGAHWFESWFEIAKNKTTIYLRELHNGNDDNDTWYSSSWFESGGIRAVNLTINGYVSFL